MFDGQENHQRALVRQWMGAFDVVPNLELQDSLIAEEAEEVLQVFQDHPKVSVEGCTELLKEGCDFVFVVYGYDLMKEVLGSDETLSEYTETLTKVAVKVLLDLESISPEVDVLVDAAFNRVVESNMSKLDDAGNPIRNEVGKVMKGPNYKAPDLTDLGERLYGILKV